MVGLVALLLSGAVLFIPKEADVPSRENPAPLSVEDKTTALHLARASLTARLTGEPAPSIAFSELSVALQQQAACFVTLTKDGRLRGCILDSFTPHESIAQNVMRNVLLAAFQDPRFPPVTKEELDRLVIEISVLSPQQAVAFGQPEEILQVIRPGIDGVILTTRYGTSTFLPQVWEQLPTREEFLSQLCLKHGAPSDCWRTDDLLEVQIYQVDHFTENDPQSPD